MRIETRNLTKMALLLALVIVLGIIPSIPLGFIPVPLTVQNIGILLIGVWLTPISAVLTTGLFLFLVAIGLPILTGMRGGLAVFMGPTGGYLVGYLLGTILLAWWINRHEEWWILFAKVAIIAILVIDLSGILGFMLNTHSTFKFALVSNAIFIPGDLIKAGIVALVGCKIK